MREFPDVLGMDLSDAITRMKENGQNVSVRITKPDRGDPVEGYDRVIKQEQAADGWVLTVCKVPDAYR